MTPYGFEVVERDEMMIRVDLSGELDLTNATELELRLDGAAPGEARLVLDLNRVAFIDSAAIHVLFRLARHRGQGQLVVVIHPDAPAARTLEIVGLEHAATMVASIEVLPLLTEQP